MSIFLFTTLLCIMQFQLVLAQEGRPALPAETAESLRVLQALHEAFPQQLNGWKVDDESKIEGIQWFHDGGAAVRYPFPHEYKITYVSDLSPAEAELRRKAFDREQKDMMTKVEELEASNRIEVQVWINYFEDQSHSSSQPQLRSFPPFDLTIWGAKASKLFLGNWKVSKSQKLDDGYETDCLASKNPAASMGQIQALKLIIRCSSGIREEFLKKVNLKALKSLIGQNFLDQKIITSSTPVEQELARPLEGKNVFRYVIDGGDFSNSQVNIKHSESMEQAYLRNNHPDPKVTTNAVTRLLVQEDGDTQKRTPYPFADITIPFIRKTGEFEVLKEEEMSGEKATFTLGINCWNGCEWSISAISIKVKVNKYDLVGGFVEGTFSGEGMAAFRPHEHTDRKPFPVKIKDGYFRIKRKADRY